MKDNNIVLLGKQCHNNKFITPEQVLQYALKDIQQKQIHFEPNKAIVLLIKDTEQGYEMQWYLSNLSLVEATGSLSCAAQCLRDDVLGSKE